MKHLDWRTLARIMGSLFLLLVVALDWPLVSAQDGKKGKGKGKGQQHILVGRAPKHLLDVILGRPTDRSVVVSVLAYEDIDCYLDYSQSKDKPTEKTKTQRLKAGTPHLFNLGDLKADTLYRYQLYHRQPEGKVFTAEPENQFHTQRKPGKAFTFTMQADSHLDQATRSALYEQSLANALADKPDFHIDLGDTFMTDKYDRHTDALPQYLAQRYYFGQLARSVPLFLVLGNHDGERGDRVNGEVNPMSLWSCLTRKKYFPNPAPNHFYSGNTTEVKEIGALENYYAWEWGDALFIALDPYWFTERRGGGRGDGNWSRTLGTSQYRWLQKTLENSKASFKFVFIHHLVGGQENAARGGSEASALYEWGGKGKDGKNEFKAKRPGWEMPIHELFVKHKVSAVFHGHDHFYAYQERDGIVYQLVPQPGHQGSERVRNVDEYGYIRGEFLAPSGHLRVKVGDGKAVVDYVKAYLPGDEVGKRKNGSVAHTYTLKPAKDSPKQN